MKVVACIIARTTSTRLPLKVLRDAGHGQSILDLLIDRVKEADLDDIYLCTSTEIVDDIMEDIAIHHGINIYRGSADSVIDRMINVLNITDADALIRITGDNPLTSYEYFSSQIKMMKDHDLDYVRLVNSPLGSVGELVSKNALLDYISKCDPNFSEYMMLYLYDPKNYKCGIIKPLEKDYSNMSFTVDTPEDLVHLRRVINLIKSDSKLPKNSTLKQIISLIDNSNENVFNIIDENSEIKLPNNESISYFKFKKNMKKKEDSCAIVNMYDN